MSLARSARPATGPGHPPILDLDRAALFLDVDGTIAHLEATPEAVGPASVPGRLLDALSQRLGGRLAVVSGRSLADLDRVFEGRVPAVAAVHGLVRRRGDGQVIERAGPGPVAEALADLEALAEADPGLLVEDKGAAVALHYRRHPDAGPACRDLARRLGERLALPVLEGDMVVELRAPGPDKGAAVAAFMAEPPFTGHTPVFVGDDLTDEDGFRAAQRMGGYGVIVGARRPTSAEYAVSGVAAARAWLTAAVERGR